MTTISISLPACSGQIRKRNVRVHATACSPRHSPTRPALPSQPVCRDRPRRQQKPLTDANGIVHTAINMDVNLGIDRFFRNIDGLAFLGIG
jgi:hypothetical protein